MKIFKRPTKEKRPKSNSNWNNPSVLDVNLIKDEIGVSFDWKKFWLKLFVMGLLSAAFIVQICLTLKDWQEKEEAKATELSSGFKQVSQELRGMKAGSDAVAAFKEKLDLTTDLMDNHLYWTNFFNWLEKKTLSSVEYDSFEGGVTGEYSLSANTNSYADISWQVKSFLDDDLTLAAKVESGSAGDSSAQGGESTDGGSGASTQSEEDAGGNVSFEIELQVNPEIFYKH